jgi:hypothetical protein
MPRWVWYGISDAMLLLFCFKDKETGNVHKLNIKAPSCSHWCSGKAIRITEHVCVCVLLALGIQHEMRMRNIVFCGLPRSTTCPYYLKWHEFRNKLLNIICVFWLSLQLLSETFFFLENWARYDQKYTLVFMESTLYSCPILMKLKFSQQILEKFSNIILHGTSSSGWRVAPCGKTDGRTDRRTLRN